MITGTRGLRWKALLGGATLVLIGLGASGCLGLTLGGRTAGQSRTAHGSGNANASGVAPSVSSESNGSDVPTNWPWVGATLINFGIPGVSPIKPLSQPSSGPKDVDELAQMGANSVHLHLNMKNLSKQLGLTPSQAWNESMQWLDLILAECKKDHMVAIVHLRSFPDPSGGFYDQTTSEFWTSGAARQSLFNEVRALANHLKGYGSEFAAYDILSEPTLRVGRGAEQPPDWVDVQKQIVQTIRAIDPNRWIIVKPGPWGGAGGYKTFQPLPYSHLVYSVHIYAPHAYTFQGAGLTPYGMQYPGTFQGRPFNEAALERFLGPVINFQNRNNVLVWVGEFGAVRWAPGSEQYLTDLVDIFDRHGWGWSYFAIGGWNGLDPNYDAAYVQAWKAVQSHRVGLKSQRWQTLQRLFHKSRN